MLRVRRLSWISIAQRTASTALGNSASTASPAVLKMRPPALGDEIVGHLTVGREAPQRLFFILGNQPAVAGNIGRKNRRDLALHERQPRINISIRQNAARSSRAQPRHFVSMPPVRGWGGGWSASGSGQNKSARHGVTSAGVIRAIRRRSGPGLSAWRSC